MMTLDEFNSKFSGTLHLELSEPAEPIGQLLNEKAPASAVITVLQLPIRVAIEIAGEYSERHPTPTELNEVIIDDQRVIRLQGHNTDITEHTAPNRQRHFTVTDLFAAIEQHERLTRCNSDWFGGIDVHHIFFEGLSLRSDGGYDVHWGS